MPIFSRWQHPRRADHPRRSRRSPNRIHGEGQTPARPHFAASFIKTNPVGRAASPCHEASVEGPHEPVLVVVAREEGQRHRYRRRWAVLDPCASGGCTRRIEVPCRTSRAQPASPRCDRPTRPVRPISRSCRRASRTRRLPASSRPDPHGPAVLMSRLSRRDGVRRRDQMKPVGRRTSPANRWANGARSFRHSSITSRYAVLLDIEEVDPCSA